MNHTSDDAVDGSGEGIGDGSGDDSGARLANAAPLEIIDHVRT